jgi:hypothetical protein
VLERKYERPDRRTLIESIAAEVEDLPELAEDWEDLDDDERFAAAYDWDLVVAGDYLVFLQSQREACELTGEQEERYAELKARLIFSAPPFQSSGSTSRFHPKPSSSLTRAWRRYVLDCLIVLRVTFTRLGRGRCRYSPE